MLIYIPIPSPITVLSDCSKTSAGYDTQTGICYGLKDTSRRKDTDAVKVCKNDGAAVAIINSQVKLDFISAASADIFNGLTE